MTRKGLPGLTAQLKDKLIQQALERRLRQTEDDKGAAAKPAASRAAARSADIPEQYYRFHLHPGYQQIRIINDGAARMGIPSPFFKVHEGTASATTQIGEREYINYSSYNYLGLSGHPAIKQAAVDAVARYCSSVSARRLVTRARTIHSQLELQSA